MFKSGDLIVFDPHNPREFTKNYEHGLFDVVARIESRGENGIYKCHIESDPFNIFPSYRNRNVLYVEEEDITYAPEQRDIIRGDMERMANEL